MIYLLDAPITPIHHSDTNNLAESSVHSIKTADGKEWGPFTSKVASEDWLEFYSRNHNSIFTARDLYEGRVQGDETSLISAPAFEFGTHPFTEVHDIMETHDNGRVVFYLNSSIRPTEGNAAVMVSNPEYSNPSRHLPATVPPPKYADVSKGVAAIIPSRKEGQVIIFQDETNDILVGWRPDKRHLISIKVMSRHHLMEAAVIAAKKAAITYAPTTPVRSSRIRDYQRELVYKWERQLELKRQRFDNIEECIAYAGDICETLSIEKIEVKEGRANLKNNSYFSRGGGIVLARHMMTSDTIIHELAHYVVSLNKKTREASHGPIFVGTLAALYAEFANGELEGAFASAKELGIDYDEEAATSIHDKLASNSFFKP